MLLVHAHTLATHQATIVVFELKPRTHTRAFDCLHRQAMLLFVCLGEEATTTRQRKGRVSQSRDNCFRTNNGSTCSHTVVEFAWYL